MKNQVKLKSCTIILISILVIINLEIGNTQTILKMRDMVPIKYPTVDINYSLSKNEAVRICINNVSANGSDSNSNVRFDKFTLNQILVLENGDEIPLKPNERVVSFNDTIYLCEKYGANNGTKVLSYYILDDHKLMQISQIEISFYEQAILLNNGNFLLTDEYELFGTKFAVYNNKCKLLNENKPFDSGFSCISWQEFDTKLFVYTYSDDTNKSILTIVDAATGETSSKKSFNIDNPFVNKIFVTKNNILFVSENYINAINYDGSNSWSLNIGQIENNISLSYDMSKILVSTKGNLYAISTETGNINVAVNLTNLIEKNLQNREQNNFNYFPYLLELFPLKDEQQFGIFIGQFNVNSKNNEIPFINKEILLLNINGEVIFQYKFDNDFKVAKIIQTKSKLYFFNENSIYSYEN